MNNYGTHAINLWRLWVPANKDKPGFYLRGAWFSLLRARSERIWANRRAYPRLRVVRVRVTVRSNADGELVAEVKP